MKKLSKAQKAKNKATYKKIRKAWDNTNKRITYKQFKNRVISKAKADNISIKEAIKKEANTETFVSAAERSRTNLINAIKEKHREAYDELRNVARENGKFIKLKDNLEWDENYGTYVLRAGDNSYLIDVTNSPEEVFIREI